MALVPPFAVRMTKSWPAQFIGELFGHGRRHLFEFDVFLKRLDVNQALDRFVNDSCAEFLHDLSGLFLRQTQSLCPWESAPRLATSAARKMFSMAHWHPALSSREHLRHEAL